MSEDLEVNAVAGPAREVALQGSELEEVRGKISSLEKKIEAKENELADTDLPLVEQETILAKYYARLNKLQDEKNILLQQQQQQGIGDLMQQFENTKIFDELVARSWACPGDSTIKLENRSFAHLKRAVSKLYRSEEEPILSYFRDPKDLSTTQLINSDETLLDYFDIGAPRPKILYKVLKDGDKEPYVTPPASPGQSPGSAPSADTLSQDMGSGTSSIIASVKLRTNVARAAGTLDEKKICCALTGNFEKLEMRSQHLIQICHILPKNLKPEQIETIIKRTFEESAIKNLDHDAKLLAQG